MVAARRCRLSFAANICDLHRRIDAPANSSVPKTLTAASVLFHTDNQRKESNEHQYDSATSGTNHLYYREVPRTRSIRPQSNPKANCSSSTSLRRRGATLQTGIKTLPQLIINREEYIRQTGSGENGQGYTPGENGTLYQHTTKRPGDRNPATIAEPIDYMEAKSC